MGRGRRVGRGDLARMDYWWRCGAANPMVMVLSSSEDFGSDGLRWRREENEVKIAIHVGIDCSTHTPKKCGQISNRRRIMRAEVMEKMAPK
jgi:hypothetical protein